MWSLLYYNELLLGLRCGVELLIWFIVSQCYRIENYCKSMEGLCRRSDTNVCFQIYSVVLEVPELVNFHSNLRPRGTKHTHEHTQSLNIPKAPCRYPAELWMCTLIHLYTHYTNMTHSLPTFSPSSCRFRHYTQI